MQLPTACARYTSTGSSAGHYNPRPYGVPQQRSDGMILAHAAAERSTSIAACSECRQPSRVVTSFQSRKVGLFCLLKLTVRVPQEACRMVDADLPFKIVKKTDSYA